MDNRTLNYGESQEESVCKSSQLVIRMRSRMDWFSSVRGARACAPGLGTWERRMAEWPDVVCLVQIEAPPGPNTRTYRSNPGLAGGTFVTLVREVQKSKIAVPGVIYSCFCFCFCSWRLTMARPAPCRAAHLGRNTSSFLD